MVEHATVNRRVVGSSPTRGAINFQKGVSHRGYLFFYLFPELDENQVGSTQGKWEFPLSVLIGVHRDLFPMGAKRRFDVHLGSFLFSSDLYPIFYTLKENHRFPPTPRTKDGNHPLQ